ALLTGAHTWAGPWTACGLGWIPHGHGGADALVRFPGGEGLSVAAILEAPGEVVAKSSHSMLYRAAMRSGETAVRPACAVGADEAAAAARRIGAVTHPNLVPLRAVYVGPRGEKLLVHPFYAAGSLHRFLQEFFYVKSAHEPTLQMKLFLILFVATRSHMKHYYKLIQLHFVTKGKAWRSC
uniref:Protein kinase domain-containing protein n=1 Tax=Aegilops tauschii subsp. strangulata TaxID=200361 RepID=A0A453P3W1_AEGTS